MIIIIINIKCVGLEQIELLIIENGFIKGWNLFVEGEIFDGQGGMLVFVLIELYVYLCELGQIEKEDLVSGFVVVLVGGYGMVVCMFNICLVIDDLVLVCSLIEKVWGLGFVWFRFVVVVIKGEKGE